MKDNVILSTSEQLKNKTRKQTILLSCLLIIIAIATGLYIGYQKLYYNSYLLYKNSINDLYDELVKSINTNTYDINNLNVFLSLSIDTDIEEISSLSDFDYELSYGLDYQNKEMLLQVNMYDNTSEILEGTFYLNDYMYIECKQLFDYVINLGENDVFSDIDEALNDIDLDTFDSDDYLYVIASFKNMIINSLDKDKFTISKEVITIDNKDFNVRKVSYLLDEENMENTLNLMQNEVLNDTKLLEIFSKYSGSTVNEIKEIFNEDIDMSGYEDITLTIYVNNLNEVIAGKIYVNNRLKFEFNNIDTLNIKIYTDDATNEFEIITTDNDTTINYEIKRDDAIITGELLILNDTFDITGNYKFDMNYYGYSLVLEGNITINDDEMQEFDTSNSVLYEDLTEEELEDINNKFEELLTNYYGAFYE